MISEIYDKLPEELVWNVVKYMQHPTAKIINGHIKEYKEDIELNNYEWDFLKHVYINNMLWTYCSDCYRKMDSLFMYNGGHCPHCDIYRYDYTADQRFRIRMHYKWRKPYPGQGFAYRHRFH